MKKKPVFCSDLLERPSDVRYAASPQAAANLLNGAWVQRAAGIEQTWTLVAQVAF